jgi:hypothetical protein
VNGIPLGGIFTGYPPEQLQEGFFEYDERHHVIYIPSFQDYNPPNNPNVMKYFAKRFSEIPRCELKQKYYQSLKTQVEGMSEAFHEGFDEPFTEGLPEGLEYNSNRIGVGLAENKKDTKPPKTEEEVQPREPKLADDPQNLADLWNDMVVPMGFHEAPKLNKTLKNTLKAALEWESTREGWIDLFSEYRVSKFLHGQNDKNFKMEFVFLFKKGHSDGIENYIKVLNGAYRDKASNGFSERTQSNLEVAKRLIERNRQMVLAEGDGYGSNNGLRGVHRAPLALSRDTRGEAERCEDGDILGGHDGIPYGAGDVELDMGPPEPDPFSEDRGAA